MEFARALDDFLSTRGTKPDDLFAVHYLSALTIPAVLADDLRDTINKQGPHLSTARLSKQGCDVIGIAGDTLGVMVECFEQLPHGRRAWFAGAEQLARDVLTQLPAASTGPVNQPAPLGGAVIGSN